MKITWLYIELSGNKLKIIWNQIESKLKSIESKLKSNWNHLKVIWNYDSTNYSDPLTSKLTSLKSTPQMLGGGGPDTNQDPTLLNSMLTCPSRKQKHAHQQSEGFQGQLRHGIRDGQMHQPRAQGRGVFSKHGIEEIVY